MHYWCSEDAFFCGSLWIVQVWPGHMMAKGSRAQCKSKSPRCPTPAGCWFGGLVDVEAGEAGRPWEVGSSGSEQGMGGRRSSGAEWCWRTVASCYLSLTCIKYSVHHIPSFMQMVICCLLRMNYIIILQQTKMLIFKVQVMSQWQKHSCKIPLFN